MAATLLVLLGGIIGVGFIGNLFFERTRIPAVLLLIAIGIFLGPITRIVPPENVRPFMPFFGAIALTIILFEGGLDLDLQHTIKQAGRAVLLAALVFSHRLLVAQTPRTLLDAVFQSVTTRTAGFQVESQLRLNTIGLIGTILLMIIGASPQSTGGGIKTTVLARLFKRLDPRDEAPSSRGLFAFKPFRLALSLIGFYLLTGILAAMLLIYTDLLSIQDAAFEAFSALGTVGLTREVTPTLSVAGKWIDIVLMYCGRVLYPILVIWMIRGRRESPDPVPWA